MRKIIERKIIDRQSDDARDSIEADIAIYPCGCEYAAGYVYGAWPEGAHVPAYRAEGARIERRTFRGAAVPDRGACDAGLDHVGGRSNGRVLASCAGCKRCHGLGAWVCEECDGGGTLTCDLDHEHDCASCGGEGRGVCRACAPHRAAAFGPRAEAGA